MNYVLKRFDLHIESFLPTESKLSDMEAFPVYSSQPIRSNYAMGFFYQFSRDPGGDALSSPRRAKRIFGNLDD